MTKRKPKTTTPDGGMRIRRNDTAFIVQIKGGALADLLREAAELVENHQRGRTPIVTVIARQDADPAKTNVTLYGVAGPFKADAPWQPMAVSLRQAKGADWQARAEARLAAALAGEDAVDPDGDDEDLDEEE
jgi:hypothetical protein